MSCDCTDFIGTILSLVRAPDSATVDARITASSLGASIIAFNGFCICNWSYLLSAIKGDPQIPAAIFTIAASACRIFEIMLANSMAGGFTQTNDDDVWIENPPFPDMTALPVKSGNGFSRPNNTAIYRARNDLTQLGTLIVTNLSDLTTFQCEAACNGFAPFFQITSTKTIQYYVYTLQGQQIKSTVDLNALNALLGGNTDFGTPQFVTTTLNFDQIVCTGVDTSGGDFAPFLDCCQKTNDSLQVILSMLKS